MRVGVARALVGSSDFGLLGNQSSLKMGDSLLCRPMNRQAKCDAGSFILGGEIHNRTNTHKTHKSNRYIHTLPKSAYFPLDAMSGSC